MYSKHDQDASKIHTGDAARSVEHKIHSGYRLDTHVFRTLSRDTCSVSRYEPGYVQETRNPLARAGNMGYGWDTVGIRMYLVVADRMRGGYARSEVRKLQRRLLARLEAP